MAEVLVGGLVGDGEVGMEGAETADKAAQHNLTLMNTCSLLCGQEMMQQGRARLEGIGGKMAFSGRPPTTWQ